MVNKNNKNKNNSSNSLVFGRWPQTKINVRKDMENFRAPWTIANPKLSPNLLLAEGLWFFSFAIWQRSLAAIL